MTRFSFFSALFFAFLSACAVPSLAQSLHAVWVLNEGYAPAGEQVTLGRLDASTNVYESVITFPEAAFASDVMVATTGIYVAADSKVYRVDADSYEVLAEAEVPGARKLQAFNGQLFVTRGDVVAFDSYLWALNLESLEVETVFDAANGAGPSVPAEGMVVVGGELVMAVNNGFTWGEEVGRLGRLAADGSYTEMELPAGAENPVHVFAHEGDVCLISNGSWSSTAVSRVDLATSDVSMVALADVTAGCNAAALVEDRLAFQISGESTLRQVDAVTLGEEAGLAFSGNAYYAMATEPISGQIYATHTDWFSYGEVEVYEADGTFVTSFPCGVSPGNIAFEIRETASGICDEWTARKPFVPVAAWDLSGRQLAPQEWQLMTPGVRIEWNGEGAVRKVIRP